MAIHIHGSGEDAVNADSVLTNLKNRGMKDAFIICTDGLKGFPEAIEAVYPNTLVQTCIVHMVRASLKFVSWRDRRGLDGPTSAAPAIHTLNDRSNTLHLLNRYENFLRPPISA